MSLSHDTDAKVTTADIELARKLVAQFQDDDFDCERISFELACHRHALIAERDAMRGALERIVEVDQHFTILDQYDGSCAAIARAALGGNHHGS